jgi:hypothetical protein
MNLLRYLMAIVMVATISSQACADATEDTVNAIFALGNHIGIIQQNPRGKDSVTLYTGVGVGLTAEGNPVPLSADMNKYFEAQLKYQVKEFNKQLKNLETAVAQLPAGDFKKMAEKVADGLRGAKGEFLRDPVLSKYL